MDGSFLRFYVHENDRLHGRLAWEWLLEQANDLGDAGRLGVPCGGRIRAPPRAARGALLRTRGHA